MPVRPQKMHQTLALALPLAIEWMATLVGLGNLDNKVKGILEEIKSLLMVSLISASTRSARDRLDQVQSQGDLGGKDDEVAKAKEEVSKVNSAPRLKVEAPAKHRYGLGDVQRPHREAHRIRVQVQPIKPRLGKCTAPRWCKLLQCWTQQPT